MIGLLIVNEGKGERDHNRHKDHCAGKTARRCSALSFRVFQRLLIIGRVIESFHINRHRILDLTFDLPNVLSLGILGGLYFAVQVALGVVGACLPMETPEPTRQCCPQRHERDFSVNCLRAGHYVMYYEICRVVVAN